MKGILIFAFALSVIGCGSGDPPTTHAEVPKPTKEQLDKMPPQAAAHAAEMSDYAKKMAEQNQARNPNPTGQH
jgi:hypothetical protein